ncbi:hypothetical protein OT109_12635 [Phycisphaeraceae bacterium D3-23]
MGMGFLEILILIMMNGGGGSDLLDYVPTDLYWEQNSVRAVSAEAMQNVLEDDSADDLDRLMAIRTLGELGEDRALAILGPLVDSNEPFVGSYARRSIAWIAGEDPEPPATVTREQLDADLALLPAEMMIVAQSSGIAPVTGPIDMGAMMPDMAAAGGPSPAEMSREIGMAVLDLIEQVGNARLDALTFAMAFEEDDDDPTMVMLVARGQFNRGHAIEMITGLDDTPWDPFTIDDIEVLRSANDWGEEIAVMMPGDDRLVFMLTWSDDRQPPIDDVAMLIGEGETEPSLGGMLLDQLDAIDLDATPIWMVMEVPAMMKVNEPGEVFGAFDAMRIVGEMDDQGVFHLSATAQGTDADAVAQTANVIQGYIDEGIMELTESMQFEPEMKSLYEPMLGVLRSIELTPEGETLNAEAQLPYGPGGFFSLFFMGM